MDPLSDILALLKPRNYMSAGFDAGGDWSLQFPDQQESIKCGAVVAGRCWLSVDGAAGPIRLDAGDCFVLPSGRPFRMASHPSLPPVDARDVFTGLRHGGMMVHNGGGDFLLVSSRFALAGHHAASLLRMLPPIVHIRDESAGAALRWSVERMMEELREGRPGSVLIIEHLAHIVLVQALRLHLAGGGSAGVGWLFALADRQMAAAIGAMHAEPGQRWTLAELASRAGMSRSSFAERFRETVGASPIDYLTRWRMVLAGDRLANSRDPVAVVAAALGYGSEAAFSTAFKRVMGAAPRRYAGRIAAPPSSRSFGAAPGDAANLAAR